MNQGPPLVSSFIFFPFFHFVFCIFQDKLRREGHSLPAHPCLLVHLCLLAAAILRGRRDRPW